MLLMLATSLSPIGPCGTLGQFPFGDNFRHASTALLISTLDCGENAGVVWGGVGWGRGEAVGLRSKYWDSHNDSAHYMSRVRVPF